MVFFLCSFFFDIVQLFKLGPLLSVCIAEASGAGTGKEVRSFIFVQIMLFFFFTMCSERGPVFLFLSYFTCLVSREIGSRVM